MRDTQEVEREDFVRPWLVEGMLSFENVGVCADFKTLVASSSGCGVYPHVTTWGKLTQLVQRVGKPRNPAFHVEKHERVLLENQVVHAQG